MSIPEAARVVDLERHPIHRLDSPQGAALVAGWRRELDRTGACNLQDFLTRAGARELAAEAEAMLPQAYERTFTVNFRYRDQVDPDLPASHSFLDRDLAEPRERSVRSAIDPAPALRLGCADRSRRRHSRQGETVSRRGRVPGVERDRAR